MNYTLYMHDPESGRQAEVSQTGIEYLPDLLETLLTFLHASGYTYAKKITVIASDGQEWSTL